MSSPIGSGGQYTPGSPQDQATRQQAAADSSNPLAAAAGAVGSSLLAGPLTMIFGAFTAGFYNSINVVLNASLYGIITAGGALICIIGLWGLSEEIPVLGDVTSGTGKVAKKGAEIAGLAALL